MTAFPLVSCLTVTQPGRFHLLAMSVNDFVRQTYPARELVILHDGGADSWWDVQCRRLAAIESARSERCIRVVALAAQPRLSLGELRNCAIAQAQGEWICQWDDDDRYHPDRLAAQMHCAVTETADAVFLTSQMHWFYDQGEMRLEDWRREPYPLNVVQGSLLARAATLPAYPALPRGEDTALLYAMVRRGLRVARLHEQPWLYCYQHHGGNTWDLAHHRAGALAKRYSLAAMRNVETQLAARWHDYQPPLPPTHFVADAQRPLIPPAVVRLPGIGAAQNLAHSMLGAAAFTLTVAEDDQAVAPSIRNGLGWEPEIQQCLLACAQPGTIALDIGAHLGYFSLLLSRAVGPTGRVIAVEPEPRNFQLLQHNLAQNHCHNTEALPLAISAQIGNSLLVCSPDNSGDHRLATTANATTAVATCSHPVRTTTLDALLPEATVNLIKLDIQGSEAAALQGARALIERSREQLIVVCEFEPAILTASPDGVEQFISTLEHLNTRAYLLMRGNRVQLTPLPALRESLYPLATAKPTATTELTHNLVLCFSEAATLRLLRSVEQPEH